MIHNGDCVEVMAGMEPESVDAPRKCIEPGCENPAGTPWTDLWCLPHDEERRARITASLDEMTR